jgi:hypothetical protein
MNFNTKSNKYGPPPKESVGASDQMTVSQHSKSEGWHLSPLTPIPSSLFCNHTRIFGSNLCVKKYLSKISRTLNKIVTNIYAILYNGLYNVRRFKIV